MRQPDELIVGLAELTARLGEWTGIVLADVGCGDGRRTLRVAEATPDALVVGIDAEVSRLGDTVRRARRRRAGNLLFLRWAMEKPLEALAGRCRSIEVVAPWGSLLAGVLGQDEVVLANLLSLGQADGELSALVDRSPWQGPRPDGAVVGLDDPGGPGWPGIVHAYERLGWQAELDALPTRPPLGSTLRSTWTARLDGAGDALVAIRARRRR
jgi:SAM-dependent methyltransferase